MQTARGPRIVDKTATGGGRTARVVSYLCSPRGARVSACATWRRRTDTELRTRATRTANGGGVSAGRGGGRRRNQMRREHGGFFSTQIAACGGAFIARRLSRPYVRFAWLGPVRCCRCGPGVGMAETGVGRVRFGGWQARVSHATQLPIAWSICVQRLLWVLICTKRGRTGFRYRPKLASATACSRRADRPMVMGRHDRACHARREV